jgi:hypothetical protein
MGNTTREDGIVDVVVWLPIATAGNLVGGVGLMTLFRLAQAHEQS